MENITLWLARILGKGAFLTFAVVSLLLVTLLAAVNMTSSYALKLYVEDQIERLPSDIIVYQLGFVASQEISTELGKVEGVERLEEVAFLRMRPSEDVEMEVDGKPLKTTWLSLLQASDPNLLPPDIRPKVDGEATMVLTGSKDIIGGAYLALQGAKRLSIILPHEHHEAERVAFSTPLGRVVRAEIPEINRWFMDRIGSITFIPEAGVILVMVGGDIAGLRAFDSLARGSPEEHPDIHVQVEQYLPEVSHVTWVDRGKMLSGWDINGSLQNLDAVGKEIGGRLSKVSGATYVDNVTMVLLRQVDQIARVIGLISLLISLPLLFIAWALMGNLCGLLMLNERRKLGLMRLRGVPSSLMGRSLLLSVGCGCLLGGLGGVVAGTIIPLWAYEGKMLPLGVLTKVQQPLSLVLFLACSVALVLLVSRRLVRYASTISPLEASRRVVAFEAEQTEAKFSLVQVLALLLGIYKVGSWVVNFSLSQIISWTPLLQLDLILDYVGLPLFVYGLVFFLASRRRWMQGFLAAFTRVIGGALGSLFLKHWSFKTYRIASFLLIVALMSSVSLYPMVTREGFQEKGVRATKVQMGTELQVTIKAADLIGVHLLKSSLRDQVEALQKALAPTLGKIREIEEVKAVAYTIEALLPFFYIPGYGAQGVPLYLVNVPEYLSTVYLEKELGVTAGFEEIVGEPGNGVAVSPEIAKFWSLSPGTTVLLGRSTDGKPVFAPSSGSISYLPGMPSRAVSDRQSYAAARIDYLNYLLNSTSFLLSDMKNPQISDLDVLSSRIVIQVRTARGADTAEVRDQVLGALPVSPLEVKELGEELKKVGSDMFIFLAMENMRIYIIGGLFLAILAILAIALVNYREEKHNFGLLRVRGASPNHIFRLFCSGLFPPAIMGLLLGGLVALIGGYGMTNVILGLRQLLTVMVFLPTHLVIPMATGLIGLLLLAVLSGVILIFSIWAFRRTVRESLLEM